MARSEELIGIFNNDNFEQLFNNASIMSVSVEDSSQVMSHPLEDGSKTSDHQVFDLIRIQIPIILSSTDFVSVYQSIDKGYKNSTLYTIQTKVSVYKNMIIDSKPHQETVESGIRLALSFTQFDTKKANVSINPKYASDSNTSNRGVQNGTSVSDEKRTSILGGLVS